jgi:hypothetical protein
MPSGAQLRRLQLSRNLRSPVSKEAGLATVHFVGPTAVNDSSVLHQNYRIEARQQMQSVDG